jgi:replicative DNA helicase
VKSPQLISEILDRLPPQDLNAERQVIGGMMLDPSRVPDVAAIVAPGQFYCDAHQRIARQLLALCDRGLPIDALTLTEQLRAAGDLDAVGGAAYLAEILNGTPVAAHAVYHARIVLDRWNRRQLIAAGLSLTRDAWDVGRDPQDIAAKAEATLAAIGGGGAQERIWNAPAGTAAALTRIDQCFQGRRSGLPTGLSDVDYALGGFHCGELVVIAARPRVGKTALAAGMALHSATKGHPVLFVSLEMTAPELFTRMLISMAKVDGNRLRNGTLTDEDLTALKDAAKQLGQAALNVDEGPGASVAEIRRTVSQLRRAQGLELVLVDYLGRMTPTDPRAKRSDQIGELARELKTLARQTQLPVVVLAQLNREIEKAGDHRPRLAHLRESGDIEQEADVVAFIDRPEVHNPGDPDLLGRAEFIVEKNRNGKTASFPLIWDSATATFKTPVQPWCEFEEYS